MTVNNDIDDDSATKHGDSHNLAQPIVALTSEAAATDELLGDFRRQRWPDLCLTYYEGPHGLGPASGTSR